jgi:hypothetical protein
MTKQGAGNARQVSGSAGPAGGGSSSTAASSGVSIVPCWLAGSAAVFAGLPKPVLPQKQMARLLWLAGELQYFSFLRRGVSVSVAAYFGAASAVGAVAAAAGGRQGKGRRSKGWARAMMRRA